MTRVALVSGSSSGITRGAVLSRLLMLVAGCLVAGGAQADPVREAVDAGNYFFLKAFDARDAQAIAELYTEDGRVIAPGAEPAAGRAAIAAFWTGAMSG